MRTVTQRAQMLCRYHVSEVERVDWWAVSLVTTAVVAMVAEEVFRDDARRQQGPGLNAKCEQVSTFDGHVIICRVADHCRSPAIAKLRGKAKTAERDHSINRNIRV